ncbi:MAG: sulfite exporter TauE/SafE family protein [Proteobacteria bacterium]|nr:sulfite exporter TauE/SafE family protein [Pseudomonadota bacterium]
MIWLVAFIVGLLIGTAGIGGVLLIPALKLLTTLSIQAAMATSLFTFIFTGLVGTALFQRRGSIVWSITVPLCVGGALFGFVGAVASRWIDGNWLALILAVLIVAAGAYTLAGSRRVAPDHEDGAGRPQSRGLLFGIGAATGFGSGLTGVGGPALSVPMMVVAGFPALTAVGASQVIQVLAALSGSAAHLAHGTVDLAMAARLTVVEVIGVAGGVRLAHAIDATMLKRGVGVLCVVVGIALGVRTALGMG